MTYEKQLRAAKTRECLAWAVLIGGIVACFWNGWIGTVLILAGLYLASRVSWPYPIIKKGRLG